METLLRDIAQFNRDYTKWQNTLTDVALHEAIQEAKRLHYVIGISSTLIDGECEVTFSVGDLVLTEAGQAYLAQA
ncbi:hypothetical protein [Kurthia massiliensis]|uniref:hypothetical protein n=1 Tax=Kurthia massiliensis TaxID=1033739 RepID=UPI000287D488|nr:hypothetical protein [Kurthia massiliensis]